MSRGKHASAAKARADAAAIKHIDRLTDEVVEAKLRARRYEDAARRAPAMEEEIRRLRAQIAEGTSDELARVADRLTKANARVAELEDDERRVRGVYDRIWNWIHENWQGPETRLEQFELLYEVASGERRTLRDSGKHLDRTPPGTVRAIQRAQGFRTPEHPVEGEAEDSGSSSSA